MSGAVEEKITSATNSANFRNHFANFKSNKYYWKVSPLRTVHDLNQSENSEGSDVVSDSEYSDEGDTPESDSSFSCTELQESHQDNTKKCKSHIVLFYALSTTMLTYYVVSLDLEAKKYVFDTFIKANRNIVEIVYRAHLSSLRSLWNIWNGF